MHSTCKQDGPKYRVAIMINTIRSYASNSHGSGELGNIALRRASELKVKWCASEPQPQQSMSDPGTRSADPKGFRPTLLLDREPF